MRWEVVLAHVWLAGLAFAVIAFVCSTRIGRDILLCVLVAVSVIAFVAITAQAVGVAENYWKGE